MTPFFAPYATRTTGTVPCPGQFFSPFCAAAVGEGRALAVGPVPGCVFFPGQARDVSACLPGKSSVMGAEPLRQGIGERVEKII